MSVAYKIETDFIDQNKKENEEIRILISVINDNFPSFSAARFFLINRNTVFQIFNTLITFLIVMIQFESGKELKGTDKCSDKYNATK